MVLSQNQARSQQDQEKYCGDERDGCFLVAMRVNTPFCRLPFAYVRAAIDVQHLPGNVWRFNQEHDRIHDFLKP